MKYAPLILSVFLAISPSVSNAGPAKVYVLEAQAHGVTAKDVIFTIQGNLNFLGYDAGAQDGIDGAKTRNAIRQYQQDHGFPPTGTFTRAELRYFMNSGGNE